jgi:hypothetical protein
MNAPPVLRYGLHQYDDAPANGAADASREEVADYGALSVYRVRDPYRPDLQERLQEIGSAAMFHNTAINHSIYVHGGHFQLFSSRPHP